MVETSVVIRSFNEAEHIGDVLSAVDDQDYSDFEIILVDSGSTDGTLEIAEEYVDTIEFVAPKNFTFGYSCNVGCNAASGDFISFLSAHAIPTDAQWLGTMVENLRDDEVAMTYSNQVGANETKFSEKRLFNELFPEERKRQTPPEYFANNASSAIKKELWEDHQFNEYLTGHEDIEWTKHFMDKGYVVVYEPDACIYHIHDETWEQIYHRFEREAVADIEIGVRDSSDRWQEYLDIPRDIIRDSVAALREGKINAQTFSEIVKFRYNQHMGTASGLQSELDLESDRYEYFYGGANENVTIDPTGNVLLERSPLPEIKPNEVLIQTNFIGITTGNNPSESNNSNGTLSIQNGNYVGTVADIGANANSVGVGDVVVGETTFHCGLCSACDAEDYRSCEDPTTLGVDTESGPYARFFTVPSDYVHSLPDDIEPRTGALAGTVAEVAQSMERTTELLSTGEDCAVIGDSPKAKIALQILEAKQFEVARWSAATEPSENIDTSEAQFIIETTGDKDTAQGYIEQTPPGSVILLLGDGYGTLTIGDADLMDKIVMRSGEREYLNIEEGLELLSTVDTQPLLNGTYPLDEVESAWKDAQDSQRFPIIAVDS